MQAIYQWVSAVPVLAAYEKAMKKKGEYYASTKSTFYDFAQDVLKVVPKPLTFQVIWAAWLKKGNGRIFPD